MGHALPPWIQPNVQHGARDEAGSPEVVKLRTAQKGREGKYWALPCCAAGCRTPWDGHGMDAHGMDKEGHSEIPIAESFIVTRNSSSTRERQTIREIFIEFRMEFSTQDNTLSVIVILA